MQLTETELTNLIRSTKKENIIGDPKHGKAYIAVGSGIHTVYVDITTGESTEEIHELKKVSNWDDCDHFFECQDGVNAICSKCGFGQRIILGPQRIENGKIVGKISESK